MQLKQTDLNTYNNSWFKTGASSVKRVMWFFTNAIFFQSNIFPIATLKVLLLRLFGAQIGKGVVVKPNVNIKYPWNLSIDDFTWIGEGVWIDSLVKVSIGKNVCISQGAYLLTGNHDFTSTKFDLIVKEITLEDGVWIGAKAVVCPGVICFTHAVLTVASVATKNLEAYSIYQGSPAVKIKSRLFK